MENNAKLLSAIDPIAEKARRRKKRKESKARHVAITVTCYLVLTLVAVFLVFPFFLMVMRSFMNINDIYNVRIIPTQWTFDNYIKLFTENNYLLYFWNTLKIVLFNIIAVPLSASLCAFSFARLRWKGKKIVFGCVLATLMIPGTVTQVPLYVMFSKLGWLNTMLPLTIPALFGGGAINIFLLRQFMRGLPKEIDEAAKIDGANTFQIYFRIIMPLCKPILLYVAVGAFASSWTDFYSPLIYLNESSSYTLAVAIYQDALQNSNLNTANLKMAAGVFMSIVPAIVFFLYQRKLIDGLTLGAVKG